MHATWVNGAFSDQVGSSCELKAPQAANQGAIITEPRLPVYVRHQVDVVTRLLGVLKHELLLRLHWITGAGREPVQREAGGREDVAG